MTKLKVLIMNKNISITEVSKRFKRSRAAVSAKVNGRQEFTFSEICILSELLDYPLEYFKKVLYDNDGHNKYIEQKYDHEEE